MDALTIAMEDALLESDKEVMEVEDQGSKDTPVPDPVPVSITAPVTAPVLAPVPAPIPSPAPTPTLAVASASVPASAPELLTLKVASVEKSSESTDPDPAAAPTTAKASKVESSGSNVCKQCKGRHPLYRCASFRKLSHEKKLRFVVLHRHCYRCLSTKHLANECKSLVKCNICHDNHHSLLHSPGKGQKKKDAKPKPHTSAQSKAKSIPYPVQASNVPLRHAINLSPTLKVNLLIGNRRILVRAVLDLCCPMSYVCESLVQQLRLPVSSANGVNICGLTIGSIYAHHPQLTLSATVRKMVGIRTPPENISNDILTLFDGIQLADPTFNQSGQVALVLGPELSASIIKGKIHSSPGLPLAQYTLFGWVISGQSPY
ncbi:uncharacterized protein LOC119606193 [Lucilia sericata]|uniref:uncharacterized protein LOC119606193 n=1 Tax=Lucilia sericata TaxID=13632 RepID=UPI0018A7E952|nr:uncharacterized protein LOC119606193 [Lucilia sericata]XP_037815539.1 uncharacterized protein LOC119606193 [Lucilia sericata]XP_037815540.1 uncharacterized protein LOC119606193 [Lucilia sericata]XP_037815541.1 uncharacterized protein LOC119606193 [Lucilia sericata]